MDMNAPLDMDMNTPLRATIPGSAKQSLSAAYQKLIAAVAGYRAALYAFIPTQPSTGAELEKRFTQMHAAMKEFNDAQTCWFYKNTLPIIKINRQRPNLPVS